MSTMNFSVPDDVKEAFNEAYKGQNKSAVIAELMREAVERAQRKQRLVEFWIDASMRRHLPMKSFVQHGKKGVHDFGGRCQRRTQMVFSSPR